MAEPESPSGISRRDFVVASSLILIGASAGAAQPEAGEAIIDIHQHLGYSGRPDDVLLAHQRAMGITTTILLPAGRSVSTPSTHDGVSNGLQAQCLGNESCRQFAQAHSRAYRFAANEVPDVSGAIREIERYLKLGGMLIAE